MLYTVHEKPHVVVKCEKYDCIIIDTPPINIVTDAMELAKAISGIILVVRYGKTTVEDVDDVFKRIDLANMNLLGFIINGIKSKRTSYYSKYKYKGKYYYKKGYGYGYGYFGTKQDETDEETSKDKSKK